MTEETNKDVIWPIGIVLSAALHAGGLYYLISHARAPGAVDIPTPAISVNLVPTKLFDAESEEADHTQAAANQVGQAGENAPELEKPIPQSDTENDPERAERLKAEAEARERLEAEQKTEAEQRAKAEAERLKAAQAEAEAKERAEAEAREKAEAELREKAQAEEREKAEAERRAKELAEAKAEEKKRVEAEERAEAERERRAEERNKAEKERKARRAGAAGVTTHGESQNPDAPTSGKVSASTGQIINYKARIRAHLARLRVSANKAGSHILSVSFYLAENGSVIWAKITRSSGNPQVDQAVLGAIYRASPFPPPPAGTKPKDRQIDASSLTVNVRR